MEGQHVFIQEENGVLIVSFANRADKPTEYLLLQHLLSPSEQDKRLGQDKVYVEVNDQRHSAYGGIKQIKLKDDQLLFKFDEKIAFQLGIKPDLDLTIGMQKIRDLRTQLSRLFAGQDTTIDVG